jgi:hypothetical protein
MGENFIMADRSLAEWNALAIEAEDLWREYQNRPRAFATAQAACDLSNERW